MADAGRYGEAAESYRRAIDLHPRFSAAHFNLGNVLQVLGQGAEAAASYRRALDIQPDFAEAHLNLGNVLRPLGRHEEALHCYRRALASRPDYALAWSNLGATFNDLGKASQAVPCCQYALQLEPGLALAHYNLANAQRDLLQPDAAVVGYRKALAIEPRFTDALLNLGNTLAAQGRTAEALDSLRRALKLAPGYARAHVNLGNALKDLGQFDEAVVRYRHALNIDPDYAEARSNLLFCLSHGTTMDAAQWFAEHCEFGARLEGRSPRCATAHGNSRDPQRNLKIGFVSADLRNHAVAFFLEPVLEGLGKSPHLELHAYSNHPLEDDVTQRLKQCFARWNVVFGRSDEAFAARVRADGIDILVDLSGHTGGNRLLTFARKPAPVQASWLGYPGTTGLKSVDYYLADHHLVPDASVRALFVEKIVYLPATAPFLPSGAAPEVNALPARREGRITFGSFNRMNKLSPAVVTLWSGLLRELPASGITLAAIPRDAEDVVAAWFAAQGVARERLAFHPRCDMTTYLALHHRVDICLDTFPYNGGTTTSHALWMGVPTLTLAGHSAQGRVGAAILNLVGLQAFVARDHRDFVDRGLRIAADIDALAQLRAGLRAKFRDCPATRPALIADAMERAFRQMWQRWCADLPPAPLDVSVPGPALQ